MRCPVPERVTPGPLRNSNATAGDDTDSMWKGLTERAVRTSPDSAEPKLVGRTYAIPSGAVWDAAVQLAGGELRGWTTTRMDDQGGVIEARVRGMILPLPADFVITVTLDENAQTRVDLTAEGRHRGGDLGANGRRVHRFCAALDRALAAGPHQVLNAPIKAVRAA